MNDPAVVPVRLRRRPLAERLRMLADDLLASGAQPTQATIEATAMVLLMLADDAENGRITEVVP